jgi:hypothetical protein
MTIDPWQHMLEQIQPDYKHWRDLLDESAVFVVNIHKLENFGNDFFPPFCSSNLVIALICPAKEEIKLTIADIL